MHEQTIILKRIFNKNIAFALVKRGCPIIDVEQHKDNPNWVVFKFELNKKFNIELSSIMQEINSKS